MFRTAVRGAVLSKKPTQSLPFTKTPLKKSRFPAPTTAPCTFFLDVFLHHVPPPDTLEAIRTQVLSRMADPLYMLQLTLCLFCVGPTSLILYNIGLLALFRRRTTRIPKEAAIKRRLLYGVDVSSSQYLTRSSMEAVVHFAAGAHREQLRKTGDPYITHCIHTALILESILQPALPDSRRETAIICALLHDVLDDTSVTCEDIQHEFGIQISTLVREISDLSSCVQLLRRHRRPQDESGKRRDAEDKKLRSVIIKRLEDPLILAVKLADRLHNLRTLHALPPSKQRAVAQETQSIFCTLAEGLGLFSLKAEMEDLCFSILDPEAFWNVYQQVQRMWASEHNRSRQELTSDCVPDVEELLRCVTPFTANSCTHRDDPDRLPSFEIGFLHTRSRQLMLEINMLSFSSGLDIDVVGRVKSLYSTYQKMQKKQIALEHVYDVLALRVVVKDNEASETAREVCYRTLSVVQYLWKQIPAEFDDYIVEPKESGYQSLHASVKGPGGLPFEVQIRTASMDRWAEYSHAAHWQYKEETVVDGMTLRDAIWGKQKPIVGRPVVQIRGGSWRDGIVIGIEKSGRVLIVAVCFSERISLSYGSYTFAVRDSYTRLLNYIQERNYTEPGSGNPQVIIERYVLCKDRAYHLIDTYGYKHATIVRPVSVFDSNTLLASHLASLDTGIYGTSVDMEAEDLEIECRVTYLRSLLEHRSIPGLPSEVQSIGVIIGPENKIHHFPRGTTAAEVVASRNAQLTVDEEWVTVNDRLVRADTPLKDGDYVILSKEKMNR